MGAILVTYKVFPEDIVKDFDPLKAEIVKILPAAAKVEGWGEEPVAFGLVALLVQIRFPEDVMGIVDEFEVAMSNIKGVSQVQTFQIRRTSKDF
jgi:translation elongation factor aEF-1 beta